MLTIFNRQELMVVLSNRQLFRLQNALAEAGIGYHVSILCQGGPFPSRSRGTPFNMDALDTANQYKIYVHKNDHHRAKAAIQPVLREF